MLMTDASSYKEYLVVLIRLVLECDYLMVYSEQKGLCAFIREGLMNSLMVWYKSNAMAFIVTKSMLLNKHGRFSSRGKQSSESV